MPSDVRLEDNDVVIEGHRVQVLGEQIELCSLVRQRQSDVSDFLAKAPRRALAHGEEDQLALNPKEDYNCTEVRGHLVIRGGNLPASIYFKDKAGNTEAFFSMGQLKLTRDLCLTGLKNVGGEESLLKTLNWMHQRLIKLERKTGSRPAGKIPAGRKG